MPAESMDVLGPWMNAYSNRPVGRRNRFPFPPALTPCRAGATFGAMYTIIGGDKAEYGPVTSEQIHAWIAAKRASLDTLAREDGSTEWKRLGEFPEFMPGAMTPPPLPDTGLHGTTPGEIAREILARNGKVRIMACFERSWELLKGDFWGTVGTGALVYLIQMILFIPAFVMIYRHTLAVADNPETMSSFSPLSLGLQAVGGGIQAVFCGFQYYLLKKVRGEPATLRDAFAGFSRSFLPLLAAGAIGSVLSSLGMVLILPGLYLAVCFIFAQLLILDQGLGPWTALMVSLRIVTPFWFPVFAVLLLGGLLALAGLCAFVIGLLVALPLVMGAVVVAYESIVNPRRLVIPTT